MNASMYDATSAVSCDRTEPGRARGTALSPTLESVIPASVRLEVGCGELQL